LTSCYYNVDTAGAHYKLTLIKETNPSKDPKKVAPQQMEADTGDSVHVGRVKKCLLNITHGDVSGNHASLYPDGIEDTSSNGTLVIYNRSQFV
jgi:hypothetical protein